MELTVLEIGTNRAFFSSGSLDNQGYIFWSDLEQLSQDKHKVVFSGKSTEGAEIQPMELEIELNTDPGGDDGGINATKVFWAIYRAAQKILCPECNKEY